MQAWWQALEVRSRIVFVGAVLAILALTAGGGWWLFHPDRAVLFADLRPQDAATMAAELEKMKVGYTVADNGATLHVERSQVHATRMKLMGRDLPLHGTVGFELFNNADFGMTEFAQKINYQRALQGELTRTILSFPEVRDARVHLALPEQGLFRQPSSRPKAAVTLSMRSGLSLRPEQVSGIQRLVAASVPGLAAAEVTLLDEQGIALSRPAAESEAEGGASARLDLKRETENYLSRKAGAVLERAFGPGQALASVDATLNMEQVRVTTEDVIPAADARAGGATGVLVRERESARDSAGAEGRAAEVRPTRGSSMQREVEYQAGRRVEQVVSQPGSIRRLQVVAVLRLALDAQQQEEVRRMVAAAVGASFERGDTVVVQSFRSTPGPSSAPLAPAAVEPAHFAAAAEEPWIPVALAVALLVLGWVAWTLRHRRLAAFTPPALTEGERHAALRRVEAWLEEAHQEPAVTKRQGVA